MYFFSFQSSGHVQHVTETDSVKINDHGTVNIGDHDFGIVSENSSSQLRQSNFSYSQDMAIRIIPQSNFRTWAGITGGHWTLDVDTNTLTNDDDSTKKIKLMTGLYLLRDIGTDIKVKSSSLLGMKDSSSISQITQLVVTPYMDILNAVVNEYDNNNFTTAVEGYWRPNWDSDFTPYYGVKNDWRKM